MRSIYIIIIIFQFSFKVNAQKPLIDTATFYKWRSVESPSITNDGRYLFYYMRDNATNVNTLVYQSFDGKSSMHIKGITGSAAFSANSRYSTFPKHDSLFVIELQTMIIDTVPKVLRSRLSSQEGNDWLAILLHDNQLVLRNLANENLIRFSNVKKYEMSRSGNTLVFESADKIQKNTSLYWLDLQTKAVKRIYQGDEITQLMFSKNGLNLTFADKNKRGLSLFVYSPGKALENILESPQLDSLNLTFESLRKISQDGGLIFFNTRDVPTVLPKRSKVMLDIWSYKDLKLQSLQLAENNEKRFFLCVFCRATKKLIRLEQLKDEAMLDPSAENDDAILIRKICGEIGVVEGWNANSMVSYQLFHIKTNLTIDILKNSRISVNMSPAKNFLYYIDQKTYEFKTYDVAKSLLIKHLKLESLAGNGIKVIGWTTNDEWIVVKDEFDIWLVDPKGIHNPISLTHGYGRLNNIEFGIIDNTSSLKVSGGKSVFLTSFNHTTKRNGVYRQVVGSEKAPKFLSDGEYVLYAPGLGDFDGMMQPLKATRANHYIVKIMSAHQSPNFHVTSDFLKFRRISDVFPESDYNWLTSELVSWKSSSHGNRQGVLYKPENFDSTKRYPVIFHIYERKSHLLNRYFSPEATAGDINIPYFVSQGYLVFTPDLYFQQGKLDDVIVDVVISAIEKLRKLKWVDSSKLGIQGFSFGGFETNIIIGRTNLFAAAMSGAGISNLTSFYGGLLECGTGASPQGMVEGNFKFGVPPWEDKDLYIRNSPVFNVSNVKTPLLMMHNKKDGGAMFYQSIELFTALRRSRKPSWLLQYDNGYHGVDGLDASDLTFRMKQFFDYYLKNMPPPKWMTGGRPANLKEIDDRLELDSSGTQP